MQVTMWKISDVRPYENNPRINDPAVDAVAASIQEFGFRQPIVVDEDGVIVVGHTRYKAAIKLGLEEVPVHVATGLTPAQARAYRIADNQTAKLSDWDQEKLTVELMELQKQNFNLDLTGFSSEDLTSLLAAGNPDGNTDPDEIPEPPDEPVTRKGDLWILGHHRLLCGDSSLPEDVDRLLGGAAIHLINTDPPYNVKVEPRSNNAIAAGLSSFEGTKHHQSMDLARYPEKSQPTTRKLRAKDRPLANDYVSDEEFDRLLDAWFGNIARVLLPGYGFYIWGGYANCGNYPPFLKKHGLYFSQALIWDKEHPVLTRKDYMGAHEWCQPPDTQVLTPDGTASIKSLRDGDRVISFSRKYPAMIGLRQGMEIRTTSRQYDGPLYGVVVGDRTTWCTSGHIWSAKMTDQAYSLWCVYLMRRGSWWRVGKTKMYTTWGFGLKQRLMMEDGEDAWILSTHPSNVEATIAEQLVSVQYGIPTTFWQQSVASKRTEIQIRQLYDRLDLQELERNARMALVDHHRDVTFPIVSCHHTRPKYSWRVPMLVRTCNLLPGAMAVPVPGKGQEAHWTPVRACDVQPYCGPVYSMAVDKHHHYIADGIVTHNCFYGWLEGAAHRFFGPNNATDLWHVKKVNPQNMIHLTEKPVELAERAMEYSSKRGENVLDLFGGSGSTLIAAERTGRDAFLMELDELYCDVIVKRWEDFTGQKAELSKI